uniref:Uncharacterized protein n=1 Tax=Kwoniella bestiolae CBS 10118 TaxID=1296100 RepID=A0A1B9G951_9TREE|nr:hypothetical protein I302_02375 [Kwoniella bestiolae CBS 10118]OCF27533.1 hypothetical protein I302_02375 [Kwoniella bestiolae CBS 10118]
MTSIRPETRYNLPQPIHASGLARAHPGLGPSPTYPSARSPIHPAGFSERIVIVKAQNFSHSTSRADAFEETMFPSGSHEVSTFLEKLERMMQGRGDGDCTWAIGFASATVFSIAQIVKAWEGEARHSVSTTRAEEVHRLLFHLHTFRRHVRRYQIFHQELTEYYQTYDKEQDRQMQRTSCLAAKLLHQSEKTRHNALEDLQDLIDRGQSLEIFCFNMLSSRANDSMERLAIVTIVFLPLTFIASYFSMGFKDFTVLERSPSFFWKISVPLSVFFFLIFAYSTLKRLLKFTLNVFSRNIRTTQNTRSFQRLKYQWWQRPINIARRDRLIAKLKEIFRGFRTQDLPPPSYMPRENFTAWNAASTSYMPMPMVAAPINDGRYIPPFPHPPDDGIYPPRLYSTMSPGQRRPIPQ